MKNIAPTYAINAAALLFLLSQVFGIDLPFTSEQVESWLTLTVVIATPLFTMFRQWITGRATVLGGRGPAVDIA